MGILSSKQSCRATAWLGIILLSSPFPSFQPSSYSNDSSYSIHHPSTNIGISFVESTLDPELLFDSIDEDGFKGGVYQERKDATVYDDDDDDDEDDAYDDDDEDDLEGVDDDDDNEDDDLEEDDDDLEEDDDDLEEDDAYYYYDDDDFE